MVQRMLASGFIAGIAAGLLAALLHFAFVQSTILLGEEYETGALVHFGASGSQEAMQGHADTEAAADAEAAPESDGHSHDAADETTSLERNALSVLFMVILYVSYGLILVAGFGIADSFGCKIGPIEGLLWGLAGFASFQLAPAMGLAPELPGTLAADLDLRQIWWWSTVACTGAGIGLLAYGRHWAGFALAGALLALPHVIGAPMPEGFFGTAPPELGALFAARVLGAALVVWACLGWFAGAVWARQSLWA